MRIRSIGPYAGPVQRINGEAQAMCHECDRRTRITGVLIDLEDLPEGDTDETVFARAMFSCGHLSSVVLD